LWNKDVKKNNQKQKEK